MKNIEDILALCIEDIKAGNSTLETCLNRYPSMRRELEPLLKIALSIQEPPSVKPASDFRIRARVQLMDYIHDKQSEKNSWTVSLYSGIRRSWSSAWLKTVAIIVAVIMVFSALGTGTAYASQDSLPGDTFYPVKIGTEQLRRLVTANNIARVGLELTFADTRIAEIEALADKNPKNISKAVEGYDKNITMAVSEAEKGRYGSTSMEGLEMVAVATMEHISMVDIISDSLTADEKEDVKQAGETAFRAQLQSLRALAVENPVRATEINIAAMQNRLSRANTLADEGKINEAEDSLRQFKEMHKFGEEISQVAEESGYYNSAIETLNAHSVPAQLKVIRNMYGKVSDETIASVEEVMGITAGNHEKESNGMPDKTKDDISQKHDNYPEEPANIPDEYDDKPNESGSTPGEIGSEPEEPVSGIGDYGESDDSADLGDPSSAGDSNSSGGSGEPGKGK